MENSGSSVPLLTYGEEVIELRNVDLCINASASTGAKILQFVGIPPNHHALIVHPSIGEILPSNPCMLLFWLLSFLVLLYANHHILFCTIRVLRADHRFAAVQHNQDQ